MIKKDYFNTSHVVISQDNVQRIGELITLRALKMLCQFNQKAFVKLLANNTYALILWIFGWAIVQND